MKLTQLFWIALLGLALLQLALANGMLYEVVQMLTNPRKSHSLVNANSVEFVLSDFL